MIVDDKLVVCRERYAPEFVEFEKGLQYIEEHFSKLEVKKLHNVHYPKITNLFNDNWDNLYSFKIYQDVDIWIVLGGCFIDKNLDTYIQISGDKVHYEDGKSSYCFNGRKNFYIKFTKNLITEICSIGTITQEQACALVQAFAITGDKETINKMRSDFIKNRDSSVIVRIINRFAIDDNVCEKIFDCICEYIMIAHRMNISIGLLFNAEYNYCVNRELDIESILYSSQTGFIEIDIQTVKDDDANAYFCSQPLTFTEEADEIVYADDIQKILEQKGLSKYLTKNMITNNLYWSSPDSEYIIPFYDRHVLTGLSYFGSKLSRIL